MLDIIYFFIKLEIIVFLFSLSVGIIIGILNALETIHNKLSYRGLYDCFIKRMLDFDIGMGVLIFFWPIFVILMLLVRIKLGSPILFSQERPGRNEKIFKLYKFRTMTNEKDENGDLLPDEIRLTKFGKLLRATSLDELPEIFNIIKGDMSIIGPRPLLVKYLPYYKDEERIRHNVRPGLTGLAQINGRNYLYWDDRLKYDIEYVKNISFVNDIKIIFITVWKVLKRSDVAEKRIIPLDEARK